MLTTNELIIVAQPINMLPIKIVKRKPNLCAKETPNGVPMLIARKVKGKTAPTSSLV